MLILILMFVVLMTFPSIKYETLRLSPNFSTRFFSEKCKFFLAVKAFFFNVFIRCGINVKNQDFVFVLKHFLPATAIDKNKTFKTLSNNEKTTET